MQSWQENVVVCEWTKQLKTVLVDYICEQNTNDYAINFSQTLTCLTLCVPATLREVNKKKYSSWIKFAGGCNNKIFIIAALRLCGIVDNNKYIIWIQFAGGCNNKILIIAALRLCGIVNKEHLYSEMSHYRQNAALALQGKNYCLNQYPI